MASSYKDDISLYQHQGKVIVHSRCKAVNLEPDEATKLGQDLMHAADIARRNA